MGKVFIYSGDGHGKSPAAIGRAIQAAKEGKHVVIIQFLKGDVLGESEFVRRLEPEIKLFRFENSCSTMNLWIIRTFRRKWYPVSQKAGRT